MNSEVIPFSQWVRVGGSVLYARSPKSVESLDVTGKRKENEVSTIHDRISVLDVWQAEGVTKLVRNRDRLIAWVPKPSIDDDVADFILVDAAEDKRRIFKADMEFLLRARRRSRDIDVGDSLPVFDALIDGGDFAWACVFGGQYLDAGARIVDDVDDLVARCGAAAVEVKDCGESEN